MGLEVDQSSACALRSSIWYFMVVPPIARRAKGYTDAFEKDVPARRRASCLRRAGARAHELREHGETRGEGPRRVARARLRVSRERRPNAAASRTRSFRPLLAGSH